MKAIVQDRYGSADVLELREVDVPAVGEKDVLVRVRAAGCGPDVWHVMAGQPYLARLMLGLRRPKVPGRGWDVSGTVETVGGSVTELKPGDEVLGVAEGSFAELAVTPVEKLVRKPTTLSFEEAAAVPVSGCTALQAIRDAGRLQAGAKGAHHRCCRGGWNVGRADSQGLGRTGYRCVQHVEGRPRDRSLGANDVIDYTQEDFAGREAALGSDHRYRRPSVTIPPT